MGSDIAEFYSGKSVLITGATGFLGKVLVEKLLRSCPGIKTIYVLVRAKADKAPQERISEITSSRAFDNIRENEHKFDKIKAISGDITLPKLGVAAEDLVTLAEVFAVFHCAADVKFETPLKKSLDMNVEGTKRVVDLCRALGNPVLVYVSSAYATCNRFGHRHEIVYTPKHPEEELAKLAEKDDSVVTDPDIIDGHPNSYTLSKALAESYLQSVSDDCRVVIVRPSQVTPSLREPHPGWIDNPGGPTGLIAAVGKGIVRRVYCASECITDFIPVDMPVHLMIVAAYEMSKRKSGLKVYNCTTSGENPMTLSMVEKVLCNTYWRRNPLLGALMPPYVKFRKNCTITNIQKVFLHYIPAFLLDFGMRISGQRPMLMRAHGKLDKATKYIQWFILNEWKYHAINTISLYDSLSEADKKEFMFDVRQIDWERYYDNYTLGVRHFVFKEKPETLEKARKRMKRLETTFQLVQVLFVSLALFAVGKLFFY